MKQCQILRQCVPATMMRVLAALAFHRCILLLLLSFIYPTRTELSFQDLSNFDAARPISVHDQFSVHDVSQYANTKSKHARELQHSKTAKLSKDRLFKYTQDSLRCFAAPAGHSLTHCGFGPTVQTSVPSEPRPLPESGPLCRMSKQWRCGMTVHPSADLCKLSSRCGTTRSDGTLQPALVLPSE